MGSDPLQYLIKNYAVQSPPGEEDYLSAHWKVCLERLQIKTSQDHGILSISAKNTGLDTFERKGFIDSALEWINIVVHWLFLPRKIKMITLSAKAMPLCKAMRRPFNFDVFRQLYVLALVEESPLLKAQKHSPNILMIGDGHGVLSAVFKTVFPESRLVLVDLGKTLLVQAYHCQLAHPLKKHVLFNEANPALESDFVYCPTEFLESLEGFRFDIAINIVSMHEMNRLSICRYFDFLRKNMNKENLFYCCNREYKQFGGEEKILFSDYPWKPEDPIFFDGYCPWHQIYLSRRGAKNGPSLCGRRIPWVCYYHSYESGYGRVLHRLCTVSLD